MNTSRLVGRGLTHYWRTHLGVVLGATVASAVIVGALLVGDCVRRTLSQQAAARLGRVQLVMAAQGRFVRAALARDLSQALDAPGAALIRLAAVAARPDGTARANRATICAVDRRFWQLGPSGIDPGRIGPDEVILNDALAAQLEAAIGDEVVIRVPRPSALPRDVPLGADDHSTTALRVTVKAIATDNRFGRFGMSANQASPFNAFVELATLQKKLDRPGAANLLLIGAAAAPLRAADAQAALRRSWRLEDAQLELRDVMNGTRLELRTDRVFLDEAIADALRGLDPTAVGALTYFVNELRRGERATPYSMVTAIGDLDRIGRGVAGLVPDAMADDRIVLNRWLADDLNAQVGERVTMRYFVMGSGRRLVERSATYTVARIVPIEGPAADREWMPQFPGLAQADHCRQWRPGIPIDLDRIRERDETYWEAHRGTPKAFVTLAAGRETWSNPFGNLTAVRFASSAGKRQVIAEAIRQRVAPALLGLSFQNVHVTAQKAATPMVDFGLLFLGMSFFLIVAALLLTGLLFTFSVEQRHAEMGILRAVGFVPRVIRNLLLTEGAVLALAGSLVGAGVGIVYTRAVLWGLATVWRGAVAGAALQFNIAWPSMLTGSATGLLASLAAMAWSLRRQAKRPPRQLMARETAEKRPGGLPSTRTAGVCFLITAVAALLLLIASGADRGPEAAITFFGVGALLLIVALAACAWLFGRLARVPARAEAQMTLGSFALRGTIRRGGRSLSAVVLLACGSFLVVAVNGNRQDPTAGADQRQSGTGGFALYGETALPVVHDLNSAADRDAIGLSEDILSDVSFVPLRVRDGDDASCLNLNRAQSPRLLGVDPAALAQRCAFAFVEAPAADDLNNPWVSLRRAGNDGTIPAVADHATLKWALHKTIGDTLTYTDQRGASFDVRIVGVLGDSVLQGSLLIDREAFEARYPAEAGFRAFLIDAPPSQVAPLARVLSRQMQDYGLQLTPAPRRLARFLEVQNTYLSIFQLLGGLGILLGTGGLGMVVARNLLERRGELAVLRAVGYSRGGLLRLAFTEHAFLLGLGLFAGVAAAIVAVIPAMRSTAVTVPYGLVVATLAAVAVFGAASVWAATVLSLRGPLMTALREE